MKQNNIEVVKSDLRALLYWAAVGISKSKGGAYRKGIKHIIESYAENINFTLTIKAEFKKP